MALLGLSIQARAGGFETGFLGTRALGRGGAFVTRSDDQTALAWNPAGLAVPMTPSIELSVGTIWAGLRGARDGTDPQTGAPYVQDHNHAGPGPIPFLAGGLPISRDVVLSLGIYAPSASGRAFFDPAGPLRDAFVSMDLWMVQYALGLGWKVHPDLRLGIAVEIPHLWKARLVQGVNGWFGDGGPQPGYDLLARLRLAGGAGARLQLGALWNLPVPGLSLGLAVRPFPARIVTSGRLEPEYPGAWLSRLNQAGRLRLTDDRASMDLALPPTALLGVRYAFHNAGVEWFDVEVDGGWEGWSVMDRQTIRLPGSLAIRQDVGADELHPFQDLTIARQWRDGWSVRLGSDWTIVPWRWKARAGIAWESAVVPDRTLRLDFPSTERWTVGVGMEVSLGTWRLALSYAHVAAPARTVRESLVRTEMPLSPCRPPYQDASCPVSGEPPGPVVGTGRYRMAWDLLSVSVTWLPRNGTDRTFSHQPRERTPR